MPQDDAWKPLTYYYDVHPINKDLILQELQVQGVDLDTLSEDILKDYDMDHMDGVRAVDILAEKAGIHSLSDVLDVCCGIGGPARYLAYRFGCRVVGLDITESRIQSAMRLTQRVKLDHLVDFRHGNALDMPFEDDTFDVVIGQEAWVHVPDKPRLLAECARVLKSSGIIAFTDFLRSDDMQPAELKRWQQYWVNFAIPETFDGYRDLLAKTGFTLVEQSDLSRQWQESHIQQSEWMRNMRDEMIAKFGEPTYLQRMEMREFMDEMYLTGKMGAGRYVARLDIK